FGVDFVMVRRLKIGGLQNSVVENRAVEVCTRKVRTGQIAIRKIDAFHRTIRKIGLWHFLYRKPRIIQRRINETDIEKEIVALVKPDSEQFAVFESHCFQRGRGQFGHRQVTVQESTIDKRTLRKYSVRKLAILKGTAIKLAVRNFCIETDKFFKDT